MNILITGGAGFIGSNFVKFCLSKQHNIVVLDNLTYAGGLDTMESFLPKIKFIKGDICNRDCVRNAIINADAVVHFAAESHNTRSESESDLFYKTNFIGTKILLEESFKGRVSRFVHISTDEVYGPIERGCFSEDDKLIGDIQATSPYSKSKSLGDDLAMDYGKKGFPVIVTRGTNNFGPFQHPEKLIPRFITNLIQHKKIPIWGKGKQVRDWLYVEDHCRAIEFLLNNGVIGEAYNIASRNEPEIENAFLSKLLCDIFNLPPTEYIINIKDPRPNHDFRYSLSTKKIEQLGFNITTDFYDAIKSTVLWYKNNENWWMSRKSLAESIYGDGGIS